eukprot:4145392-Alexandrium_andersonii.AAC.1
MSASLVGSEMCIRDSHTTLLSQWMLALTRAPSSRHNVASHLDAPAPTATARGAGSCSAPTATTAAWGGHREKGRRMQMASVH